MVAFTKGKLLLRRDKSPTLASSAMGESDDLGVGDSGSVILCQIQLESKHIHL